MSFSEKNYNDLKKNMDMLKKQINTDKYLEKFKSFFQPDAKLSKGDSISLKLTKCFFSSHFENIFQNH